MALAAALVLGACGSTRADGSPSPLASATPPASAAPTGSLPGSAVRITVNGTPYAQGTELALSPTGAPVVIVMAFPFAVDRPSLDRFLPNATAAISWTDDRTLRLTYPESESNMSFKVPEVLAADKTATIGLFSIHVSFPATRVIDLFTVAELNAIKTTGVRTAATAFRIASAGSLTLSPDGRRAIEFELITIKGSAAPALIELATRARTPLAQPTAADGPFAFADWLPDGRLLLVGRSVWVGNGDGTSMRKLADTVAALGNVPWTAVPSPGGDRVALWAYNTDGHIAIVDLDNGSVTRIAGPFRRYAADGRAWLAWSRDGTVLAGTDSDGETGSAKARVRVVDLASDRSLRTIEGGVISLSSFPTGELVVIRDPGEQGAGSRLLGIVMGFDGVEHRRYLGCGWSMSPDARYIVQPECGGAGFAGYTLINVSAGTSIGFGLPSGFRRWLADGRLAFY